MAHPTPIGIELHTRSRELELKYPGDESYRLSYEFLRVMSPSAEVRGHGKGQEVLQWGKKDVAIEKIEVAGNYALQLFFDDGHDSGIYSWSYLKELCENMDKFWEEYLNRLDAKGKDRDPNTQAVRLIDPNA